MAFWIEINCSSSIHILLQTKWEKKLINQAKYSALIEIICTRVPFEGLSSNVDKIFINLNFDFIIDEQFWINEWMNEWTRMPMPKVIRCFCYANALNSKPLFFSPYISPSPSVSISFCPHHLCIQAFIFYGICVCNSQIGHMICSQWKLVSYHMNGFCIRVFCLSTCTICHYKLYSINTTIFFITQ